MGFPLGYTDLHFPNLFLHFLSILSFIRKLISTLLTFLGLPHFLEPEFLYSTRLELPYLIQLDLNPSFNRKLISTLFTALGLRHFLEPDSYLTRPDPNPNFIRKLISTLLTTLGLPHFLEPEFPDPNRPEYPYLTGLDPNSSFIRKLISTLLTSLRHFLEPESPYPTRPTLVRPDPNLGFIRKLISTLLIIELPPLTRPEFSYPTRPEYSDPTRPGETRLRSVLAGLIRELLPVVRFSEMVDPPVSCAICLYEFDFEDEIRRLMNCCHVFHRRCVDRWMDHDQKTCPLCRKEFIPEDMMGIFNEKLWLAYGIS